LITSPADFNLQKEDALTKNLPRNGKINTSVPYQEAQEYEELESIQQPLSLEDMERQMIKRTLEKHRGKRKAAAEELKISERTLYRKIKQYGLE